jgi:type IV secretory pathway VirB10-like protein
LTSLLYKDKTSFHNEFIVNSQQLLYINIGLVLIFVIYYVFFRPQPKQPTRLNLRSKNNDAITVAQQLMGNSTQKLSPTAKNQNSPQPAAPQPAAPKVAQTEVRMIESKPQPALTAKKVIPEVEEKVEVLKSEPEIKNEKIEKSNFTNTSGSAVKAKAEKGTQSAVKEKSKVKTLNIFFVYNGHEWECHEVLGIPPGSSVLVATEMYQSLVKTSDPSTIEINESAYLAILKKRTHYEDED